MKKDIRLDLGGCDWLEKPPQITIHDMSNHELDDGFPTFRDVAIILYMCVGQGAQWNLARELANRTGFDILVINEALEEIIKEYAELTEEEGYERYEERASYIETKKSKACFEELERRKGV